MHSICLGHVTLTVRALIPYGMAGDIAADAARNEALIAAAVARPAAARHRPPRHVGFQRPGSDLSHAREIKARRADPPLECPHFPIPASVPDRAITMGISTILEGAQHPADRNRPERGRRGAQLTAAIAPLGPLLRSACKITSISFATNAASALATASTQQSENA